MPLACDRWPFGKERGKLRGDFGSYFITTLPNARTEGGVNVGRQRSEIAPHFFHGTRHDGGYRAAPTGMHRSDRAVAGIEQKNRHAIGGADADMASDVIGDEGVSFTLPVSQRMGVPYLIGMNLAQRNINRWIRHARSEAMALPEEMLQFGAAIDTVVAQQE